MFSSFKKLLGQLFTPELEKQKTHRDLMIMDPTTFTLDDIDRLQTICNLLHDEAILSDIVVGGDKEQPNILWYHTGDKITT